MAEVEKEYETIPQPSEEDKKAIRPSGAESDSGIEEAKQYSEGLSLEEIQRKSEENEHHRSEKFRDNFEKVAIIFLWVLGSILVLVFVTWFYHILAPTRYHWLNTDQLDKLQSIATGGILASIATGHIRRRIE